MGDQKIQTMLGDCLELMPLIPDGSVDLIITDPPYYKVKDEEWDNQWKTPGEFLEWLGKVLVEARRILKPNGSIYLFASPQMSARVECKTAEYFNVLNNIRWRKPAYSTKAEMFVKEDLRCFFPASETIIFAEQHGSDVGAMDIAGYETKCQEASAQTFGSYLLSEMGRSGSTRKQIAALFPSASGNLTGCVSNWILGLNCPTPDQYKVIRDAMNIHGGNFLSQPYEELRTQYEELRRPFTVSDNDPYTDTWDFKTVSAYPGKHPCEKPVGMIRHMILASSRPGDLVADFFMGSGSTGIACIEAGRRFIGIEKDHDIFQKATQRVRNETPNMFAEVF